MFRSGSSLSRRCNRRSGSGSAWGRRSNRRSRSRHCTTSLVDEGVDVISKNDEVCYEYVVRYWVAND